MEEADGPVYCTFQNVSTARLVEAVASRGQPGPQDKAGSPGQHSADASEDQGPCVCVCVCVCVRAVGVRVGLSL